MPRSLFPPTSIQTRPHRSCKTPAVPALSGQSHWNRKAVAVAQSVRRPPRKRGPRIRNSSNEFRPVPEWPSAPEGDCTSRELDSRGRGNDELGDFKCDSSGGALPSCGRCNIFSIVSGTASGRNSVVECLLPKQDVVGSNPIARSNHFSLILPSELRPGLASFAFEYSLPVSWPCGKLAALSNWPRHYQGVLHGLRHPPRGRGPGELGQSLSGIGPAFRDTA